MNKQNDFNVYWLFKINDIDTGFIKLTSKLYSPECMIIINCYYYF